MDLYFKDNKNKLRCITATCTVEQLQQQDDLKHLIKTELNIIVSSPILTRIK